MQLTEPYTDGHAGEWIMDPSFFNPAFDLAFGRFTPRGCLHHSFAWKKS
jgi:hypothetical protein